MTQRLKNIIPTPVKRPLRWALRKMRRAAPDDWHTATERDVYYCCRLILNREPNADDLKTFMPLVENRLVRVEELVSFFLNSSDFKDMQARRAGDRFKPVLVELEHFKIYASPQDPLIGRVIIDHREYEPHVTGAIRRTLTEGMVFVDVGANIGYLSLTAAYAVGPRGRVICFEPNQYNCNLIQMSIQANGFEHMDLYPFAVADAEKSVIYDDYMGNGVIAEYDADVAFAPARTVSRAITLDAVLQDNVHVMKIDIEGAEYLALQGATQVLSVHHPVLFTEFSPSQIQNVSKVSGEVYLETLIDYGYALSILEEDGAVTPCDREIERVLDAASVSAAGRIDIMAVPV